MKTQIKKYAGALLAGTIVIGGIASAAVTPIPTISNTFAVAGQVIKSADLNKLAEAVNILDSRTKWVDVPLTDTSDFDLNCEYKATYTSAANDSRVIVFPWTVGSFLSTAGGVDGGNDVITLEMLKESKGTLSDRRGPTTNPYPVTKLQKRCE